MNSSSAGYFLCCFIPLRHLCFWQIHCNFIHMSSINIYNHENARSITIPIHDFPGKYKYSIDLTAHTPSISFYFGWGRGVSIKLFCQLSFLKRERCSNAYRNTRNRKCQYSKACNELDICMQSRQSLTGSFSRLLCNRCWSEYSYKTIGIGNSITTVFKWP